MRKRYPFQAMRLRLICFLMSGNTDSPDRLGEEYADEDRAGLDIYVVVVGPRVRKQIQDPRRPRKTATFIRISPRHVVYSGEAGDLMIRSSHSSREVNGEVKEPGESELSALKPEQLRGWSIEVVHYLDDTVNTYIGLRSAMWAKLSKSSRRQLRRKENAKKKYAADFKPIRDRTKVLAAAIELEDEGSPRVDSIFIARNIYGVEVYAMADEDRRRLSESIDRLIISLVEDGILQKVSGGFGVKTTTKSLPTLHEWQKEIARENRAQRNERWMRILTGLLALAAVAQALISWSKD